MNIHHLKTEAAYWDAVADGSKTFELRVNDRNYAVGDGLVLYRLDDKGAVELPPRTLHCVVTYLLDGMDWRGVLDVVLSISTVEVLPALCEHVWHSDVDGGPDMCSRCMAVRDARSESAKLPYVSCMCGWQGYRHHLVVSKGSGPHRYRGGCPKCDKFVQWLSEVPE
jgi:hypothetical protein